MNETLASQTQKCLDEFIASLPEEARQTVDQAMQRLIASPAGHAAIRTGDRVPDFTLADATGQPARLAELLASGPVVLSFFRGGWCPFCNLEFKALNDRLPAIEALGASLVGISPEVPAVSLQTSQPHDLAFTLLCDVGNRLAEQFGLLMTVDEAVRPHYLQWGIDLPAANGDDSYRLPIPATYVIDTSGTVISAHVDKDYTRRMEPDAIIEALESISSPNPNNPNPEPEV